MNLQIAASGRLEQATTRWFIESVFQIGGQARGGLTLRTVGNGGRDLARKRVSPQVLIDGSPPLTARLYRQSRRKPLILSANPLPLILQDIPAHRLFGVDLMRHFKWRWKGGRKPYGPRWFRIERRKRKVDAKRRQTFISATERLEASFREALAGAGAQTGADRSTDPAGHIQVEPRAVIDAEAHRPGPRRLATFFRKFSGRMTGLFGGETSLGVVARQWLGSIYRWSYDSWIFPRWVKVSVVCAGSHGGLWLQEHALVGVPGHQGMDHKTVNYLGSYADIRQYAEDLYQALKATGQFRFHWLTEAFPELLPKRDLPRRFGDLPEQARRELVEDPVLRLLRGAVPLIYVRTGKSWSRFVVMSEEKGEITCRTTTKLIDQYATFRRAKPTPAQTAVLVKLLPEDASECNPLDNPIITTAERQNARVAGIEAVILDMRYGVVYEDEDPRENKRDLVIPVYAS